MLKENLKFVRDLLLDPVFCLSYLLLFGIVSHFNGGLTWLATVVMVAYLVLMAVVYLIVLSRGGAIPVLLLNKEFAVQLVDGDAVDAFNPPPPDPLTDTATQKQAVSDPVPPQAGPTPMQAKRDWRNHRVGGKRRRTRRKGGK